MVTTRSVPGFGHEAMLYDSEESLLPVVARFVRQGLSDGEPVLLNLGPASTSRVVDEVGETPLLRVTDRPSYTTPVATLNQHRLEVERELADGAPGVRAVCAADFAARVPWWDRVRYEAVVNHVFASYPFHSLCIYDTREAAPEIVAGVRRTHPGLRDQDGFVPDNSSYVEPAELMGLPDYAPPPHRLAARRPAVDLPDNDDLGALRLDVNLATVSTELDRQVVTDLGYAVTEVAANALEHGARPVRVRVWTAATEILCAVTDHGTGNPDPLAGYRRTAAPGDPGRGTGLWAARQLCDELHYTHTAEGFTVWLSVSR